MNTEPEIREDPFWDFCLAIYAQPGVSDACLRLQDDSGADVTVLLYALWLATYDRTIRAEILPDMLKRTETWSSAVVKPLRSVRRYLKDKTDFGRPRSVAALREIIKVQEVAAERVQITFMAATFPPELHDIGAAGISRTARTNLICYLEFINAPLSEREVDVLCQAIAVWRFFR